MKRTLLWLAAAIAVVAACQKPENNGGNDNTPASSGEKTFTATLAPLTKVSLGTDGLALSWTKADKVSIFDGAGNKMFRAQGSGASAQILGSAAQADTYYALFPYDASATIDGAVIKATIANEQTTSAGGADLQITAAGKSDGDKIALTPVAAVLKFTLDPDTEGVSSIKIKTAEGALSGSVSIDCSGKPVLTAGTTSPEIKVSAFEGGFKGGSTYYVAALPGTVEMNLGPNNDTYNNTTYETQTVQMTGNETWTIVKKDGSSYLKFGGNAFPLMLADDTGIGGEYLIVSVDENGMLLEYPYQGEEGPSVLGIFLTPKGKETYVHSFRNGDFGVTDDGADEVQPLVDQGITWEVEVESAMHFFYMNPNAGLMIGRAWGANAAAETAKSARMWTESFSSKKIASVTVSTARFAPEEGEDKSAAELEVYIAGVKVGATYPLVNDMTPYTFTAPDPVGGLLEIKWKTTNEEVNCFWVKSVQVIYEE